MDLSQPDARSRALRRAAGWSGRLIAALLGLALLPLTLLPSATAQDDDGAVALHDALFREQRFPSAATCQTCHPDHYREWSVSSHAYATMSPIFNAMHGQILRLTNGTNGDFCMRCHSPVAMNLEEPEFMSNIDRHPTSREGITCITCHRVDLGYGKVSGRLAIVEGDLFSPIFGPTGNAGLAAALDAGEMNMNTNRERSGRNVHERVEESVRLTQSAQCGACHDVNLVNGFRLEEAFSEFKTSPASRAGITCQDCHMGKEPGVPSGYATGPAAVVGNTPTPDRKRTNHMFAGPDYSVIHPGIFPHNADASRLATIREWLDFDHEQGWGTDEFEAGLDADFEFPERWRSADDRYDARDILRDNADLLLEAERQRVAVLRAGYRLGEVVVDEATERRLRLRVEVRNGTNGHNVPTGFDAERLVWLHVVVTDAAGREVFESGDLDPNGDVRDSHSLYVHDGGLPADDWLFSLQSRFLTRMVRGGEREQVLAVNVSPDPLPFLRPSTRSTALTGRPDGARKHRQTIAPLDGVWADYEVGPELLAGAVGPYRARIELKAAMVPVNLVDAIKDVGFDYGMSPRRVADAVVAGHLVLWEREIDLTSEAGEQ
jgi:nitrate/TMAO reductase-like tetraheme cytochrome c subunit